MTRMKYGSSCFGRYSKIVQDNKLLIFLKGKVFNSSFQYYNTLARELRGVKIVILKYSWRHVVVILTNHDILIKCENHKTRNAANC